MFQRKRSLAYTSVVQFLAPTASEGNEKICGTAATIQPPSQVQPYVQLVQSISSEQPAIHDQRRRSIRKRNLNSWTWTWDEMHQPRTNNARRRLLANLVTAWSLFTLPPSRTKKSTTRVASRCSIEPGRRRMLLCLTLPCVRCIQTLRLQGAVRPSFPYPVPYQIHTNHTSSYP